MSKVTALLNPFNAQQFDPTQSAGQLPVGKHPVTVVDGEVKATKNNDGGYLQLTLKIIDGPQTGTTGPYRLNLYNQNAQTAEIAHRQLSAIAHVTGVLNIQDVRQLFNIPFLVEVGPQKNDPQYTEVKRVFDINGNEPGKTGNAPAQAPQQAQPAFGQANQQPQVQNGFGQQQPSPQSSAPAWGAPAQQQAPQQGNAPAWGNQAPQQAPELAMQQFNPAEAQANANPANVNWGGQQQAPQQAPVQQQSAPAWGQQGGAPAWGQR